MNKKIRSAIALPVQLRLPMQGFVFAILITLWFTITSCKDDEPEANRNEIALKKVMEAMGGRETIENISTMSYTSHGSTYEWEQEKPTEANPLNGSNYKYVFSTELNSRKMRFDYEYIKYNNPFPYDTYNGLIVINDKNAAISGQYNWLSYYFGFTEARAIYPSRLEAILKNQKMANPVELLKDVLAKNGQSAVTKGGSFSIPTIVDGLNIELEIDAETLIPTRAKVMEEDYLQGDVVFQIQYNEWIDVGNVKYPSKLIFILNDRKIKEETLSNFVVNPSFESDKFKLQDCTPIAYSTKNAHMGVYYSQWHHRWIAWGILIDQPLDNGALVLEKFDLSPFDLLDQKVDKDIKIIGRPDLRTWSVSIKTSEGIVIVEAPLNTYWTKSCIKAIRDEYPNEKFIAGISTHVHHVTFGGIRELAHAVGKIYVGQEGFDIAKEAINAKHTLVPDTLAKDPKPVEVIPVNSITTLAGGKVEIHPLKTSYGLGDSHSGPHSADMLLVYIPEKKVLIQADHYWSGEYMRIWNGETEHNYTVNGTAELKRIARYLLDYIDEKGLDVDKIIGIHGGFGTYEELQKVCE